MSAWFEGFKWAEGIVQAWGYWHGANLIEVELFGAWDFDDFERGANDYLTYYKERLQCLTG